jgi:hypothetical protein
MTAKAKCAALYPRRNGFYDCDNGLPTWTTWNAPGKHCEPSSERNRCMTLIFANNCTMYQPRYDHV